MPERYRAAVRVQQRLKQAGYRALLAGGCVRDLILGVEPNDYDIATSATPGEVAQLFEKVISVGAAYGVQIVVQPEGFYEVTTFRKDGPYCDGRHPVTVEFVDEIEDARRRDFTINAMFLDPESNSIIDYVGGQEDLRNRLLRTVGPPEQRFAEDHLRILRAVRFAARLGYDIEPETLDAVRKMSRLITLTSAERIRDEILKILTEGGARRGFELLDETGLLEQILPEITAMKGVDQPEEFHPEGDVFVHTMLMLEHLEDPSPALALAALLHDAGKPPTQSFEDRIRFNNHDKVGARIAEDVCRRLRMPHDTMAKVSWMIENHMRLTAIPDMRDSKRKRFIRHPWFPDLLELGRLDCVASHGCVDGIYWIQEYIATLPPDELKPEPLLRGKDLIEMGLDPGPIFSQILTAVEDAQLEGLITDKEQASEFVRAYLAQKQ
ncbi:MAG: CCA tRNA nucleotidyltransferase [Candidatus Hydrogenedentes bacterium]|nr:CCA tRNA nucleotidyltransferase [Candidatus Hydrogenedentota bacterium]